MLAGVSSMPSGINIDLSSYYNDPFSACETSSDIDLEYCVRTVGLSWVKASNKKQNTGFTQ